MIIPRRTLLHTAAGGLSTRCPRSCPRGVWASAAGRSARAPRSCPGQRGGSLCGVRQHCGRGPPPPSTREWVRSASQAGRGPRRTSPPASVPGDAGSRQVRGDSGALVLAASAGTGTRFDTHRLECGWIGAHDVPRGAIFNDETRVMPGQSPCVSTGLRQHVKKTKKRVDSLPSDQQNCGLTTTHRTASAARDGAVRRDTQAANGGRL